MMAFIGGILWLMAMPFILSLTLGLFIALAVIVCGPFALCMLLVMDYKGDWRKMLREEFGFNIKEKK